MGKWKRLRDEYAASDAKAKSAGIKAGARGTVYDSNGRLHVVPIEDVLTEDGRFRGPKGRR
jgi:hypothetical protein